MSPNLEKPTERANLPGHRPGFPGTPGLPACFQKFYVTSSYVSFLLHTLDLLSLLWETDF